MKNISLLLTILLALLFVPSLFGQESNIRLKPTNRNEPATLKQLLQVANSQGKDSLILAVNDVYIDPSGNSFTDLYYVVNVRLYAQFTNVAIPVLRESLTLNAQIEFKGDAQGGGVYAHNTNASLELNPKNDYSSSTHYFSRGDNPPYDPDILKSVRVAVAKSDLAGIETETFLENLYLEIYVDRGRYFTPANIDITPKFFQYNAADANNKLKKNEAALTWTAVGTPSTYEVEWIHISDDSPTNSGSINADFTQNAVRLLTDQPFVTVNLLHNNGYIVARARTKRPALNLENEAITDQYIYSDWSKDDVESISLPNDAVVVINNSNSSEVNAINWQYNGNYASGGKKKEVVSYFDGSNRNRQSNTLLYNSDSSTTIGTGQDPIKLKSTVISKESYYDYNGSPIINMLATPLLTSDDIAYQKEINELTTAKIGKVDYDNISSSVEPLFSNTTEGASEYYSPQNRSLGYDSKADFIPDAEGYPYQRTEFMPDGSGRLKVEYGLGKVQATEEKKGTQYAYARPTAVELERLFGSNIGEAAFYKKDVTIDPNGVMSMSYKDIKGRTVATSIAGKAEGHSNLEDITTKEELITENLLRTGADQFLVQEGSYELSYPIFVPVAAEYRFKYGFDIEPYIPCSNVSICYDCQYELTFQIVDENNELVLEAKDDLVDFHQSGCTSENYALDQVTYAPQEYRCGEPTLDDMTRNDSIYVCLSARTQYTIIKRLTVVYNDLEADADAYLDNSSCGFYDQLYFENDQLNITDYSGCAKDFQVEEPNYCSDLYEELRADFLLPDGHFVSYIGLDGDFFGKIFDSLSNTLGCADFNPEGCYGDRTAFIAEAMNRFYGGHGYYSGFYDQRNQIADFLVKLHPNYCQYIVCQRKYEANKTFDKVLEKSNNLDEFMAMGMKQKLFNEDTLSLYWDNDSNKYLLKNLLKNTFLSNEDFMLHLDPMMKYDSVTVTDSIERYPLCGDDDFGRGYYSTMVFNRFTRDCYPEVDTFHRQDWYDLYFQSLLNGCIDTNGIQPITFYDVIKGVSDNEYQMYVDETFDPKWSMFKEMYIKVRDIIVEDMISSLVCVDPQLYNSSYDCSIGQDTNIVGEDTIYHGCLWVNLGCPAQMEEYFINSAYSRAIPWRKKYKNDFDIIASGQNSSDSSNLNIDSLMGAQVFSLLKYTQCLVSEDSVSFASTFKANLFACKPFHYIDSAYASILKCGDLTASANLASIQASLLSMKRDSAGILRPLYPCAPAFMATSNYNDFMLHHQLVIAQPPGPPIIPSLDAVDINNPAQKRYVNLMNSRMNLNLGMFDYFNFANEYSTNGGSGLFGNIVNWEGTARSHQIKKAVISQSGDYMNMSESAMFTKINTGLSSLSYPNISLANDYLGLGEADFAGNHYDLYYFENGKLFYTSVLDEFNNVFETVADKIGVIDGSLETVATRLDVDQWDPVENETDKLVDRAYRYADGTVWVRVLNASDSTYYNDYYFYYQANTCFYDVNDITSFDAAKPIFDQEEMHHIKLEFEVYGRDYEMIARSALPLGTASRIIKLELRDDFEQPAYPMDLRCEGFLYEDAIITSKFRYQEYINGIKDAFKVGYKQFCLSRSQEKALENRELTMTYTNPERHFTLYYYDQADNLVMTVPPSGVNPLTVTQNTQDSIENYRNGAGPEVTVPHSKQTTYKYNSDNQMIKQSTPNGGTSLFWYDKVGRLVLSQNAEQVSSNSYSYTRYDEQSRVYETGEVILAALSGKSWEYIHAFIVVEILEGTPTTLDELIAGESRNDVVMTYYDEAILTPLATFSQENLRSRVATQAYYKNIVLTEPDPSPEEEYIHLRLDGNNIDASINNYTSTLIGTVPTTDHHSNAGKAMHFDGVDDRITIPHSSSLNLDKMTFALWVKGPAPTSDLNIIASKRTAGLNNLAWLLYTNTVESGPVQRNKLQIVISSTGTSASATRKIYSTSAVVFDDTWHHIAFTFDNNQLKLYVDGIEDSPYIHQNGNFNTIYNSTADLNLGADEHNTNGYYRHFPGDLDEFLIYDKALSATQIEEIYNQSSGQHFNGSKNWDYATHYSYDATGNVKTLLNDYYQNGRIDNENSRFKRIDYAYDVISGNVEQVYYQTAKEDAFYHRYEYDAENRITKVETSRDGLIWDEDATYSYYTHGPLARTELGEHKVQGIDYAYTLEGWLKSINAGVQDVDMGNDLDKNNVFGEDAFGMALQYNQNDYQSISSGSNFLVAGNTGFANSDLHNGNISAISIHNQESTYGKAYRYDQLNRIKSMTERTVDVDDLVWGNALLNGNASVYSYDADGNLLELDRLDGASGLMMDELRYNYADGTDKLTYVKDTVAPEAFPNDIDQQGSNNYSYDAIGNLTADQSEDISEIQWYPNGKIKRIIRNTASLQRPNLKFEYDGMGNRVKKTVSFTENGVYNLRTNYYVRDAQGNIMATYEERDCDYFQAEDSLGVYHYQYAGNYSYYTEEAANQSELVTVIDYLNGSFPHATALGQEAYLLLDQIPGIRATIIQDLNINSYLNLYPATNATLLALDPYFYANYLFSNAAASFGGLMNYKQEAWLQHHYITSNAVSNFYGSIDSDYASIYGNNTNAVDFYEMNKELVKDNFSNSTLIEQLFGINSLDYSTIMTFVNGHPSQVNYPVATNTVKNWLGDLQSQFNGMNFNPPTPNLIDKINAAFLMVDYTPNDITTMFSSINMTTFYGMLNAIPANLKEKYNALLYSASFVNAGVVNQSSLLAYKPSAALDWAGADPNGDLLKYFITDQHAGPVIMNAFGSHLASINLNNWNLYFTTPTTVRQYAYDALLHHHDNSFIEGAFTSNVSTTKGYIDQTQSLSQLTNYYKTYHPDLVLTENYNHDGLNNALSGLSNLTAIDYGNLLQNGITGVDFGNLGGCNPHEIKLLAEQFTLYGSKRLGLMDAKKKRKDEENLYSRKLGAKNYELSDHLGNVVATISDKKVHPQELLTNGGQTVDASLGFQADVTGRYDYYPFGMEIMSRSGDFNTVDYTTDNSKILYQGLLKMCNSYTASVAGGNCNQAANIYGDAYVASYEVDEPTGVFFTVDIELKTTAIIPNLEANGKYKVELLLVGTEEREAFGTYAGENATVTSPSAGAGAPAQAVTMASDKVISFTLDGATISSSENAAGVNELSVVLMAPIGGSFNTTIGLMEIKVSEIFENTTTPLAMRNGSVYPYGFNGMEREAGAIGVSEALYTESFDNTLVYHENFSSELHVDKCSGIIENTGTEDRYVVDLTSNTCGLYSDEFTLTEDDRYKWTIDVDRLNSSQKIILVWEYYDYEDEIWRQQRYFEPGTVGRNTYIFYNRSSSTKARMRIRSSSSAAAGYVYDLKVEREKNSQWNNNMRADGEPRTTNIDGRLKLQTDKHGQGTVFDNYRGIPVEHKGEEHTISYDFERLTVNGGGVNYIVDVLVQQSDNQTSYSTIGSATFSSTSPEIKKVVKTFTPTKDYLRIVYRSTANTTNYPIKMEAYLDNIVISDGHENATSVVNNNYDFGARIYDGRLGRWLSIDPEFKRYPYSSPYVGLGNNPIYYLDPDGETLRVAGNETKREQARAALQKLTNDEVIVQQDGLVVLRNGNQNPTKDLTEGTALLRLVSNNENTSTINIINSGGNNTSKDGKTINFNPTLTEGGLNVEGSYERPPEIGLAHEFGHVMMKFTGLFMEDNHDTKFSDPDDNNQESQTINYEEYNARVFENIIRAEQGEPARVLPDRVETGGPPAIEDSNGTLTPAKPIEVKKNPAYD